MTLFSCNEAILRQWIKRCGYLATWCTVIYVTSVDILRTMDNNASEFFPQGPHIRRDLLPLIPGNRLVSSPAGPVTRGQINELDSTLGQIEKGQHRPDVYVPPYPGYSAKR